MESTHVIAITNREEDNFPHTTKENKTFQFSYLGKNEVHCVSIAFNARHKQMQRDQDTRKMIHCIKVGISLVLVSLLYLLNPVFKQLGENAMWAIMTVVVMFEFSAGTFTTIFNSNITHYKYEYLMHIYIFDKHVRGHTRKGLQPWTGNYCRRRTRLLSSTFCTKHWDWQGWQLHHNSCFCIYIG